MHFKTSTVAFSHHHQFRLSKEKLGKIYEPANSIAERVADHLDVSSRQRQDSGTRGVWPQQHRSRILSDGEK